MTTEQLAELSPEEKRVKIAEALGWERWKSKSGNIRLVKPRDERQRAYWISCGDCSTTEATNSTPIGILPNYPNDLHAMAMAVATLDDCQRALFECILVEITSGAFDMAKQPVASMHYCDALSAVHATAAQRAEAFLRVRG